MINWIERLLSSSTTPSGSVSLTFSMAYLFPSSTFSLVVGPYQFFGTGLKLIMRKDSSWVYEDLSQEGTLRWKKLHQEVLNSEVPEKRLKEVGSYQPFQRRKINHLGEGKGQYWYQLIVRLRKQPKHKTFSLLHERFWIVINLKRLNTVKVKAENLNLYVSS